MRALSNPSSRLSSVGARTGALIPTTRHSRARMEVSCPPPRLPLAAACVWSCRRPRSRGGLPPAHPRETTGSKPRRALGGDDLETSARQLQPTSSRLADELSRQVSVQMGRLYRLDSSSSSNDDNDEYDEQVLTALHQAHTQYLEMNTPSWGGSVPGRQFVRREREVGHWRLYNDFFSDDPIYGPNFFRRRFRMARPLFNPIAQAVEQHDHYFVQKREGSGRMGLSALQKITAAYAMISHGVPADFMDQYNGIGDKY